MKIKDACKTGSHGWSLRLSGENLLISNNHREYIYTNTETHRIENYKPNKKEDWMPLLEFPDHIPSTQNHDWHRQAYKKFRKEELDNKIKRPTVYCKCGRKARYTKKRQCTKCYLKEYNGRKK